MPKPFKPRHDGTNPGSRVGMVGLQSFVIIFNRRQHGRLDVAFFSVPFHNFFCLVKRVCNAPFFIHGTPQLFAKQVNFSRHHVIEQSMV